MNAASALKENKLLLLISLVNFLIIYLSVFNKAYGYFIDEFYYIACANRPAFGYVDHPPLAPIVLTLFQSLFGNSIYAIRILPALASSAAVLMTGVLTREIGGGKLAQLISAITMVCVPVFLAFGGFYSMNAFEPLLTLVMFYFVIRIVKTGDVKKWLPVGVVIGLGIMNKHTFVLIVFFLLLSLIISGQRRLFINRFFIYSVLISFIIVIPNIIWQIQYGFPTLEFYRNINSSKNVYTPPVAFILTQIINYSPAALFVWLPGLIYFLVNKKLKQFRFVSVFFLLSFLFFLYTGTSRADRLSFVYPVIITGGGIFWESVFNRKYMKWVFVPFVVLLISGAVLALPVILPYFSYDKVKSHTEFLGLNTEIEIGKKPPLPQLLADRIGWEEKVNIVGTAFKTLSSKEQKETIIAGENYGQAGALELYGKKFGFPFVASGHNNYYLWSKEHLHGSILIQLGTEGTGRGLKEQFNSVYIYPEIFSNEYVSGHENKLRAYICKGPKISTSQMLENGRNYH